jgi:DNA-binding NarL/FixJ family response regulator/class 3 adenylate cyclase
VSELPTGTVTFLIADIEASTLLVREAGPERYTELLATVRRIIREATTAHGGTEVEAIGDEQLAAFPDALGGVEAALAIQRAMLAHDWQTEHAVRVRIGLHTGAPSLTEEGYVGIDIIRASRIALSGHGGETLLSSTTAAFASAFETRSLGAHRLAGLAEPETIHQLLADDLPRDFPPLRNTVSQLGAGCRVVIAEDTVLLREGVVRLLGEAGFEVVGQSGTAEDLLRHVAMHKPDVAIVDIRMPPTHTDEGLRAAREIRERFPDTGVLVLSQYVESGYALDLLSENAEGVGYLLKDRVSDLEEFATSVRRVSEGGSALDPEVVATLVGRRREHDPLAELTPREREVLELMAEGRTNQAIADRLFVTLRAVEKHVTSIFTKLGLPAGGDDHRRVLAVLAYLRE